MRDGPDPIVPRGVVVLTIPQSYDNVKFLHWFIQFVEIPVLVRIRFVEEICASHDQAEYSGSDAVLGLSKRLRGYL